MALGLKRKQDGVIEDHQARKRVKTAHDSNAPAPPPIRPSKPAIDFPMFSLLPMELQLQIFEQALEDLADKPRIALLGATSTPCFDKSTPGRGVTIGWTLIVENSEELHRDNPYDLAHRLLQICPSGAHIAKRFFKSHVVWDPPHYCGALQNLDLSLDSDIFWLPDDLYQFFSTRAGTAASPQCHQDESWIRRLMISLDTLEEVMHWSQGRILEHEMPEGYLSSPILCTAVLETIFGTYSGCTELIVVVGAERRHLSWDEVRYVPPAEGDQPECNGPKPEWEVDQDAQPRCRALWDEYYSLDECEEIVWPEMSFAFAVRK